MKITHKKLQNSLKNSLYNNGSTDYVKVVSYPCPDRNPKVGE